MSAADPRDRAVDSLLRRTLGETPVDTRQCPDAETLAAWMDGALNGAPLQSTETHVAGCARCQAITAGMTVAATAARPASDAAPARGWFDWRWMVPLAAGAAAVLAWAVLPESRQTVDTLARGGTAAPVAELPAAPAEAPPQSQPAPASEPAASLKAGSDTSAATPAVVAGRSRRAELPAAPETVTETVTVTGSAPLLDASTTPPDRPADIVAEAAPAPAATAPPPAPTAQTAPAAPAADRTRAGQAAFKAAPSPLWRVNAGRVERSGDNGASWQDVPAPSPVRAVAGPSAAVVWAAGSRGGVLRSTDGGATWQTLTAPSPTDLVSVDATSDQHAIVTDTAGARFETHDGGRTWAKA